MATFPTGDARSGVKWATGTEHQTRKQSGGRQGYTCDISWGPYFHLKVLIVCGTIRPWFLFCNRKPIFRRVGRVKKHQRTYKATAKGERLKDIKG